MQIIIAVECLNKSKSDNMYFKTALDYYYQINGNNIKLNFIYMNGKSNYKNIENKIKSKVKQYSGDSVKVYCLDYDNQMDSNNVSLNKLNN